MKQPRQANKIIDRIFSGSEQAFSDGVDLAAKKAEGEGVFGYISESIDNIFTSLGDAGAGAILDVGSVISDSYELLKDTGADDVARRQYDKLMAERDSQDPRYFNTKPEGMTVPFLPDLEIASSLRSRGEALIVRDKQREVSAYDDYWISPTDIGGVGASVGLAIATIAFPPSAVVTIPAMAAQAADGVFGEYARVLAENPDMQFDPRVAAALTLLVAVETVGSKAALVDLPKYMAARAMRKELGKKGSKEAAKSLAKKVLAETGAIAAEGAEEYAEEGLEALITILYKPEFEGLRESMSSGELGVNEWAQLIKLATAGGLKTFVLGAAGGGAGRVAAGGRAKFDQWAAERVDKEGLGSELLRDVRRTEAVVGDATAEAAPEAAPEAVEEVAADDVPEAGEATLTASDLDTDEFADIAVSRNPEGVDSLFLTPTGKERNQKHPPSQKAMVDAGVIPEGVTTNRTERQAIYDRLRAARERAANVTEETLGPDPAPAREGESWEDIDFAEEGAAAMAARTEDTGEGVGAESIEAELEMLKNRHRILEGQREDAAPGSDESFNLDTQVQEIEAYIQHLDPTIEFSRAEIADTANPDLDPDVQTSDLIEEPGTQMGSMPGGLATSSKTGKRYYIKRYTNAEQTRNEAVANRLYDAAGVNVPNVSLLRDDDGNIVGVASEVVPGVKQGESTDAADGLVIDAWLANWDVVGEGQDNLLVGPNGESVRIDQGGALTTRAQGAPKGEAFGPKVGEMESIPAANEAFANASPDSMRAGFDGLRSITDQQIKDIVKSNSTGDTAADNQLIATLIKRRRDLLSREQEFTKRSEVEFSRVENGAGIDEVNRLDGTDYVQLTEEEVDGLTENEKGLKRRAEQRLGRRVVYLRSPSGNVLHNGFIESRNSNVVYVIVANDITSTAGTVVKNYVANRIAEADQRLKQADRLLSEGKMTTAQHERAKKKHAADVAKAKSQKVTEQQVIEAYEMALLQTVLHENVHLTEGKIGDELTPEQQKIRSDAGRILKHIIQTRHGQARIAMLQRRLLEQKRAFANKEITEEQFAAAAREYESEVTAESLTDMRALSASGIETLYLDRGRLKAALNRVKRIANRLGGPKDVRVLTRVLNRMENGQRGETTLPSSPSVPVFSMTTEAFLARRPDLEFSRAELLEDSDQVVVPLADISVTVENPTPENVLQLFVSRARWAKLGGVKSAPGVKAYDTSAATITAALEKLGITPTPEIIEHVIKNYNKVKESTVFETLPDELRGENEVYAPAGEVEREISLLFDRVPSPTAAQLQTMPGSPSPRRGVTESKSKVTGEKDIKEFIANVISSVKAVEGRVITTDSEADIQSLLKTHDVVVYTGGTKPIVHANQTWTDRFAKATDYEVIKSATIEAAVAGYHNWYRDFGKFFRRLGGDKSVNEAAMIFGVTSAQSAVENNIADTLHIMRLAREHFRDGKPRTVEALMESFAPLILDSKGNKTYKDEQDREDGKPQRTAMERRTRFTADGTAKMFVSGPQLEVIAEFYINGMPEFGGAIKIRTYAGQIAEAAFNRYYPFSVQDRHQAAMYGFFKGTFNKKNGKFSYDKVFRSGDNALEFRYASYLTQRLSMEPELRGLTPSQIQALQWFHTKAGKGPYPEIEAKTDKGLIANYAADNPDLRTGTLESALKFAEFEIADFMEIMESDIGDDVRFPAADVTIPSFSHGPGNYQQGQAIARDFGGRFENEGSRIQLISKPSMSSPGLVSPEGMTEFQMDSMFRGIIETVTETDGSIRILNDMGLPHMPLVSLAGAVNGQSVRGLQVVPLVGSISSPATARIVGALLGLGTLQPRMATSQPSPEGNAVTLRIKRADGKSMSPDDATSLLNKTSNFGKGNSGTWQTMSPTNGYVEVTVTSNNQIDDNLISQTFEQISKEFQSESGIEITGEAHRTEYEIVEQSQYAEILSSSGLGLSAQGPSGILGRVVSEVTSPVLSVLQANGFGFNRNEFQEGFGLDRAVVASISQVEFSRANEGIMPLAEQDEMRRMGAPDDLAGGDIVEPRKIQMGQGVLAENALVELDWWAGLSQDERSLMNAWTMGSFQHIGSSKDGFGFGVVEEDFYNEDSALLDNKDAVSDFIKSLGPRGMFSKLRGVGNLAHGSLALPVLMSKLTHSGSPNSKGLADSEQSRQVVGDAIKGSIRALRARGDIISPTLDAILFPDGQEDFSGIHVFTAFGPSDIPKQWITVPLPEGESVDDYTPGSLIFTERNQYEFLIAKGSDPVQLGSSLAEHYRLTEEEKSKVQTSGSTAGDPKLVNPAYRRDGTYEEQDYDNTVSQVFGSELYAALESLGMPEDADIAGIPKGKFLYNDMVKAMAKAPFLVTDRLFRAADGVSFSKFARTFSAGSRFRVSGPASASADQKVTMEFHKRGLSGQFDYLREGSEMAAPTSRVFGTHFIIQSPKTARAIAMNSSKLLVRTGTNDKLFRGFSDSSSDYDADGYPAEISKLRSSNPEAADDVEFKREVDNQLGLSNSDSDPAAVARIARQFTRGYNQNNILDQQTMDQRMPRNTMGSDLEIDLHGFEAASFPGNELEAVVMPGTVFEVVSISPHLVTIKEVELSPDEASSVPILSEFSRVEPGPEVVDDIADMSTNTAANVKFENGKWIAVRRAAQDRFIQLDHLQRDVEDAWGHSIDLKMDAVNRLRNMPGRIAHAAERFSDRVIKPLAKSVSKLGMTQAEFGEYAVARHALVVNAEMRQSGDPKAVAGEIDSGLSDAEANAIIAKVQDRFAKNPKGFAKLENARKRLVSIGRKNLRMALRSGLISRGYYDALISKYGETYVPMWDAFNESTDSSNEGAEQFLVPARIIKQRTGRTANSLANNTAFFEDRMAAMADQRFRVIRKSENNTVLQRLLRFAKEVGNEDLMRIYKPTFTFAKNEKGDNVKVRDKMPDTVFRVMVDGTEVLLEVNNAPLVQAMKASQRDAQGLMNNVIRTVGFFASMQRFFATQFGNPDFTLTNPARDIQTAIGSTLGENPNLVSMTNGRARKLGTVDRLKIVAGSVGGLGRAWATVLGGRAVGLGGSAQSRREYAQYRALGGRQGFFTDQDPAKSRRALRRIASGAPKIGNAFDFGAKVWDSKFNPARLLVEAWTHVNTVLDDGVRFATYRQLIAAGVNPEKAIQTTRDLTVDFSRMGTYGPGVNAMYAFANASMQGSTKTVRMLKSKRGNAVLGSYFAVGMILEAINEGDDEDRDGNGIPDWDQIPDYQKDGNFHIPIGNGEYIKFPVAYGLAIPYVAGRRMYRSLIGKETASSAIANTLTATFTQMNPFGQEEIRTDSAESLVASVGRLFAPSMIDPLIAIGFNQDWRGGRIYNKPFPNEVDPIKSQMGRDGKGIVEEVTGIDFAQSAADALTYATGAEYAQTGEIVRPGGMDYQPEMFSYVWGAQFTGAGATAERVGSLFMAMMSGEEVSTSDIPGLRRFYTTTQNPADLVQSNRSRAYEFKEIAREADAQIKRLEEVGDRAGMRAIMDDPERGAEYRSLDLFKAWDKYRKETRDKAKEYKSGGVSEEQIESYKKKRGVNQAKMEVRIVKKVMSIKKKMEEDG